MPEPVRTTLNIGTTITLDASGGGTATLGPSSATGPANWHVTGVIVQTNRPGEAPVPRVVVYLDQQSASGTQGLSYDGSFAQGSCDLKLSRGQNLICVWSGGQSGDQASLTLTGEKW
jgi:hypothetical protein